MVTDLSSRPPVFVPRRGRGGVLVLFASVCFGSSGALAKPTMLAGLSPQQAAAARIGGAALLMAASAALLRPSLLRVGRGEWPLLLGYGLLGVAGVQLCYFVAAGRLPVSIAIVLEFASPVLIALWTRFVRKKRLSRTIWSGIALAMVGLALVAQVWQGLRLDALGLLAGLGTAVCSAAYFLLGEHGAATRSPLGMVIWGMLVGAVAVCAIAPPWTLPGAVLTTPARFGPWQPPVWLLLVVLAVFSTALAYLLGIAALRHLPAPVASVLGLAEPVVATLTAWALLGETPSWVQALGATVLLAGALLVQLNSPGAQPDAELQPLSAASEL